MNNKVYVGNMNYRTSEDQLQDLFSQYGEVSSVRIVKDKYTGRAKGFGFVEMVEADSAKAAIDDLNGKEFDGRALKVNEAYDKPRRDNNRDYD